MNEEKDTAFLPRRELLRLAKIGVAEEFRTLRSRSISHSIETLVDEDFPKMQALNEKYRAIKNELEALGEDEYAEKENGTGNA